MSKEIESQNKIYSEKLKQRYFSEDNVKYKYNPESISELLDEAEFNKSKNKFKKMLMKKRLKITASCIAACFVLVFGFGYFKPSMLYNVEFAESATGYEQVVTAMKYIKHSDDKPLIETIFNSGLKSVADSSGGTYGSAEHGIVNKVRTFAEDEASVQFNAPSEQMDAGGDSQVNEEKTFSGTNEQVLGVSEGDIVKTNGEYIFAISNSGKVNAIKSDSSGSMAVVDFVHPAGDNYTRVLDMYLTKNKSQDIVTVLLGRSSKVEIVIYSFENNKFTLEHTVTQDGEYVSSRVTNNCLYTISTKYTDVVVNANNPEDFIPTVSQDNKNTGCILPEDITILPEPQEPLFIVATGINLNTKAGKKINISSKAILGSGYQVYCSTDNMYVLGSKEGKTNIIKFELNDGKIKFYASGEVDGDMLNQFSADEHSGYFRIATTKQNAIDKSTQQGRDSTENLVTVLDKDLKEVSVLDNIAKGERIYSARFMGDTAYVVTFKQTDPLFVIDLSDPKKPKIDGELKIPGFSRYLHPLSDNMLLGIGSNTNDDGMVVGFKMSLFDVSNPRSPAEIDTVVVGGDSYSLVDMTHKALFYDVNKNLVGFPLIGAEKGGIQTFNGYVVYKIEKGKFVLEQKFEPQRMVDEFGVREYADSLKGHVGYEFNCFRGLYIDNIFYIYGNDNMSSFGYNNYKYLNNIVIK